MHQVYSIHIIMYIDTHTHIYIYIYMYLHRCVFFPNKNYQNIENTEKQTGKIQARCPGSQGIDSLDERHLAGQNSTENGLDFLFPFKNNTTYGSMDLMGFNGI